MQVMFVEWIIEWCAFKKQSFQENRDDEIHKTFQGKSISLDGSENQIKIKMFYFLYEKRIN